MEVIKDFFIKLRDNQDSNFPITTRQLESLVRLSQARAKIDLRNIVTEDDASEVKLPQNNQKISTIFPISIYKQIY